MPALNALQAVENSMLKFLQEVFAKQTVPGVYFKKEDPKSIAIQLTNSGMIKDESQVQKLLLEIEELNSTTIASGLTTEADNQILPETTSEQLSKIVHSTDVACSLRLTDYSVAIQCDIYNRIPCNQVNQLIKDCLTSIPEYIQDFGAMFMTGNIIGKSAKKYNSSSSINIYRSSLAFNLGVVTVIKKTAALDPLEFFKMRRYDENDELINESIVTEVK